MMMCMFKEAIRHWLKTTRNDIRGVPIREDTDL